MVASTDRNGVRSTFVYDSKNNLTEIRRPVNVTQTAVVRLNYDANGQLASIVDPKGRTQLVTRDALGNVTAVKNPEGGTTAQAYDQFFRVSSSNDALGRGINYEYNSLDRPTQIKRPFGAGNLTTTLTYDAVGRTTSIKRNLLLFIPFVLVVGYVLETVLVIWKGHRLMDLAAGVKVVKKAEKATVPQSLRP